MSKNPNRVSFHINADPETKERLQTYAREKHTTVSQAIIDWIWSIKLPSEIKAEEEKQFTARM